MYGYMRTHDEQSNSVRNLKEIIHGDAKIFYLFIIFFGGWTKNYFLWTNVDKLWTIDCDLDFVKI